MTTTMQPPGPADSLLGPNLEELEAKDIDQIVPIATVYPEIETGIASTVKADVFRTRNLFISSVPESSVPVHRADFLFKAEQLEGKTRNDVLVSLFEDASKYMAAVHTGKIEKPAFVIGRTNPIMARFAVDNLGFELESESSNDVASLKELAGKEEMPVTDYMSEVERFRDEAAEIVNLEDLEEFTEDPVYNLLLVLEEANFKAETDEQKQTLVDLFAKYHARSVLSSAPKEDVTGYGFIEFLAEAMESNKFYDYPDREVVVAAKFEDLEENVMSAFRVNKAGRSIVRMLRKMRDIEKNKQADGG